MNRKNIIRGRVWVVRDNNNRPIDNIDTDQIFHNKHLAITKIEEMGKHIFGNLDDWRDFPVKIKPGDILVVGKNFGSGSSRQQAVDGFIALGVQAIIGESFGAIYWRNAVNAAFPVIQAPAIMSTELKTGDEIEIKIEEGTAKNLQNKKLIQFKAISKTQMEILQAGGLFEYGKQ
ncbi:3-isopropylmalate dehydratase [bacterium]|nr:3-isopropylmalate dehydratase [bacterium]